MENLPLAANVIITGMVVVFSALIILSLVISLFSKFFASKNDKTDKGVTAGKQAIVPGEESQAETVTAKTSSTVNSEKELIAVLTAAIMASGLTRPDTKIRITSYKRLPITSPVWNLAGRTEVLSGRM